MNSVDPARLPVDSVLPELQAALSTAGMAVLEAPPGAGKTTRVPLALLAHGFPGRLVVLEPRRVAARAAAGRLASQLGEPLGERIGLTTRDERRTSPRTRIEVVTEGVLLRRLQRDPAIDGTGIVMFDEFHERNLEGDLALAFAFETRSALRPDLQLLIASATLDGDAVARLLGSAPVIRAHGRVHPVEIRHRARPEVRHLDVAVRDTLVDVWRDAVAAGGDVLVFLPGVAEIRRTAAAVSAAGLAGAPLVVGLHGSLAPREQDAAIAPAPSGRRKIVLATDVAESSITIDGVTLVVDAGLSREPRFDPATGMTGLVTLPASRASADQRAGRAGRTVPGLCVRLWPAREHAARDAHRRPAILTDDLTAAALEVAAWGGSVEELRLLDQPSSAAWGRARATLTMLGALDGAGRVTAHGRRLADLPVHPRIGQLLLHGRDVGLGPLATEVAAVLADRDVVQPSRESPCADVAIRVRALRGDALPAGVRARPAAVARARRERRRLVRLLDVGSATGQLDGIGGLVLAGWPDRFAGARGERRGSFVLAGGRGAELPDSDLLAGAPYLAVAHLDRGERSARIHLAAAVDEAVVRGQVEVTVEDEVGWREGDLVAERRERIGAVVLRRHRLADPDPDVRCSALLQGIEQEGLELLGWAPEDREFQARVGLVRAVRGGAWPDLTDDRLRRDAGEVFAGFLGRARRRRDLAGVPVGDALRARLTPVQLRDLERLAPTHLVVPSGSRVRLQYAGVERPILPVRVQEMFGARHTPAIVDGEVSVVVHLLSPARRPVQVTDDLAGFWERAYPQVRAELRGRYPKHAWPEDPSTAVPTRSTGGHRRRRR